MEAIEQPTDLDQMFRETAEDLARYFQRRHADQEQAKDLVQETFVEMARGLRKGRQPNSYRAYLFGIARKLSIAAWRRNSREQEILDELPPDTSVVEADDHRLADAREVIADLPPLQREILDLRFTQDLSYAEIAEVLDIPLGTVRSRIHHAIRAVRQALDNDSPSQTQLST